jgi:putative thioredoxin
MILEGLARKHEGEWELAWVDFDRKRDIAMRYGILDIPAVVLFVEGTVRSEFTGPHRAEALERWLDTALPERFDAALTDARTLLDQGQPELAEATLKSVLSRDPANRRARMMHAQILVFSEPHQAIDLVSDIPPGDPLFEGADAVRALGRLIIQARTPRGMPDSPAKERCRSAVEALGRGDFDAALAGLIEAMRADHDYNDGCARKSCLALFGYLGQEHELTRKHRHAFGEALYV